MMKACVLAVFLAAAAAMAQTTSRFVQAELSTTVKVKTAAVGDPVKARVVGSVTLPNGVKLGRNVEIQGQVRAVDANSIAISFDHFDANGTSTPLTLSIRAARAQGATEEASAQAGSVLGMHGVTLEVDDGPRHASKFRSEGKNLQLKQGLQLMLGVAE